MPRNAGNDENGRFDEILSTILTNLTKILFLWKFAHKRRFKVVWYPKMDQKVCLNMVKKDQLCGIALEKRN